MAVEGEWRGAPLRQAGSVGPPGAAWWEAQAKVCSDSPGLGLHSPGGPSRPGRVQETRARSRAAGASPTGRNRGGQGPGWGWMHADHHVRPAEVSPPRGPIGEGTEPARAAPHAPEMAWTATRRKPFTSPFSLTMATRCTRGTGYSRLLRYTKALGGGRGRGQGHPAVRCDRRQRLHGPGSRHNTAKQSEAGSQGGKQQGGWAGRALRWAGWGGRGPRPQRRQEKAQGQGARAPAGAEAVVRGWARAKPAA